MARFSIPVPVPGEDYSAPLFTYLVQYGLSHLTNTYQRTGNPIPSAATLADILTEHLMDAIPEHLDRGDDHDRRAVDRVTLSWLARSAPRAAEYALKRYSPDYLQHASRGGRRSKRPKTTLARTVALFPDLSAHEIAERLGCSDATVYRRRAELRHVAVVEQLGFTTGDWEVDELLLPDR